MKRKTPSQKSWIAVLATACLGLASTGVWAAAPKETQAVLAALEARDCPAAVRELNKALAESSPQALLLGGSLFEQGLCLKKDTARAARLYQRAADAGAPGAQGRLAALYASPAAGPNKGAAVWWGLQANLPLPAACKLDKALQDNAEGFAQAVGSWPDTRLDACVYAAGVLGVLDSEFVLHPISATKGEVVVDFQAATGQLDARVAGFTSDLRDASTRVTEAHSLSGVMQSGATPTPEQQIAQRQRAELDNLSTQVNLIGRDALARFPRPSGLDANWRSIQVRIEAARAP